jgi:PleD family two-component response regulator
MTASFGVTTCKELGANPKRLITQADRALYVAKLSGRNRSIHFQDLAEDALLSPHG